MMARRQFLPLIFKGMIASRETLTLFILLFYRLIRTKNSPHSWLGSRLAEFCRTPRDVNMEFRRADKMVR
jgi:hypothetical protein